MPRGTVPIGEMDAMGKRHPSIASDWQFKANKGGETYSRYIAYARVGAAVSAAAWRIEEVLEDASGNVMSIKHARTGSNAISKFDQIFDASSALTPSAITKAANGQITTSAAHGLSNGDKVEMVDIGGMVELNSDTTVDATGDGAIVATITVVDPTNFTIDINTTGYTTFTSGGSIYPKTVFGLTYA